MDVSMSELEEVIWIMAHQQRVAQLVLISEQELQIATHLSPNISWNRKKPKLPLKITPRQGQSFAKTVLEMR